MNKFYLIFTLFFISLTTTFAQKKRYKLPPEIVEASGLYIQNEDSYWWLNDSGDQPNLYITDNVGHLKKTINLPYTQNVDWEELTNDDQGHIYIGDFGNNANSRKDLVIYKYHIEKHTVGEIRFHYPDQKQFPPEKSEMNFDMEGFFWHDGTLHLFSKNKVGHGDYLTKHYTLSDEPGNQTAVLVDKIKLPKKRVVTAAAISPDKNTIALLTYNYGKILNLIPWGQTSVILITNWNGDGMFNQTMKTKKIMQFLTPAQYEAIDYLDDEHLIIASEQILFTKQRAKRIMIKKKISSRK